MARILLIDDDARILRVIEIALQRLGHEIRKAGGLESGLAAAAVFAPDLIVSDVMMPSGTEGFDLVRALRASDDPTLRDVPIIMATAVHDFSPLSFNSEETGPVDAEGNPLPVQGWIDKPIDLDELFTKVANLTADGQAA